MIISIFSNIIFWIILYGIAFICFIFKYSRFKQKKKPSVKPKILIKFLNYFIDPSIFLGPVILSLTDQPHLQIPRILSIFLGLIIIISAIFIHIKARLKIGFMPGGPFLDLRKEESLITTGIYRIIRHPIYLGFIFWQIGIAILLNAAYALVFFIIYILSYLPIIYFEERELIKKYGKKYEQYKKETPYILFPKLL